MILQDLRGRYQRQSASNKQKAASITKKSTSIWIGVLGLVIISVLSCAESRQSSQAAQSPKFKACIIDIDGTIANDQERRAISTNPDGSTNWRKYFDPELVKKDKPIYKAREVLRWIKKKGIKIFYVSSRETTVLEATRWWLKEHDFPQGEVYHRRPFARSGEYKINTIRAIQKDYDVIFGVGDRDRDIIAYQTCGITAIKVRESSEEDWVRVKSGIAKLIK